MARRRRERMSEGKKNIIAGLIQEYDIKTAEDIQEALKDLLGGTIQEMMEAELDEHLGYDEYARSDNPDYRNGVKHKKLRSDLMSFSSAGSFFPFTTRQTMISFVVNPNRISTWRTRPLPVSSWYAETLFSSIHARMRFKISSFCSTPR